MTIVAMAAMIGVNLVTAATGAPEVVAIPTIFVTVGIIDLGFWVLEAEPGVGVCVGVEPEFVFGAETVVVAELDLTVGLLCLMVVELGSQPALWLWGWLYIY